MRSMKLRITKRQIFFCLIVMTYAVRAITDAVYVAREEDSILVSAKYGILFVAVMYGTVILLQSGRKWKCTYIINCACIAAGTFLFVSVIRMIYTWHFSLAVFKIIFHMLFPAFMAVLMVNIGSADDIYRCFSWILVITLPVYCVLEIGLELFSKQNIALISFASSFSPFESHYTSGTAAALCGYFAYYRKNKILTVLALIFSILTFKRFIILYCLALVVLPMALNVHTRVNIRFRNMVAWSFVVATILYCWLMIPQNQHIIRDLLSIDSVRKFTSGRSDFFEGIYGSQFFVNFGWGASEYHLGRLLEMDLVQILIETSLLGLIVFCLTYWKIAGTTVYGIVYMGSQFINMLTSHSLSGGFIWLLLLVTFAQIEVNSEANTHSRFILQWKRR